MSHSWPDPAAAAPRPYRSGSDGPTVSYSALPTESHFNSQQSTPFYSSPPSAYEFSIFSRESLTPSEAPLTQNADGGRGWMHGLRSYGGYQQVGSPEVYNHVPSKTAGRPKSVWAWFSFWFSLIAGLLWVVPAVTLLVFNFKSYIIGASAWCPGGNCPGQSSDPSKSTAQMVAEYDRNNHNLLGGLQFGAKAAEVWFMFIAVSLVFQVTSILARSEHGLPIGYLTAYTEFTDLLYLFKPTLWTSAHSAPGQRGQKHKRRTMRYYAFGLFVAFTCIVANLVGPLVAVLMIPTLNWVDMDKTYAQRFGGMLSAAAPVGDDTILGCTQDNFTAGHWNCTRLYYGHSLDSLIEYGWTDFLQTLADPYSNVTSHTPTPSREQGLALRFNTSQVNDLDNSTISWAPNRQVVRALSQDLQAYYNASSNPMSRYAQYNNSLHLTLQRQGPIVAFDWAWIGTNVTVTTIARDKQVRCYQHCYWDLTDPDDPKPWAKCFRVGTGWNATNALANFTFARDSPSLNSSLNANDLVDPVVTNAFFADKSAWVQTALIPGVDMPPCLPNGTAPTDRSDCDYDKFFSAPVPDVIPDNRTFTSTDSFVVENTLRSDPALALMTEAHYSLGFTTYAADVSGFSPNWGIVEIDSFPDRSALTPLAVHPAWYLAAWSVADGANVGWARPSARQVQLTTQNLHDTLKSRGHHIASNGSDYDQILWAYTAINAGLQTASLLPYTFTDPSVDGLSFSKDDGLRPQLWNNVRRQVWSFGLDSRTSKLSVGVVFVAVALVALRSALMVVTRTKHREPGEMLIAAMKHSPRGEFETAMASQMRMERVRFGIQDDRYENIHFAKR